MKPPIQVYITDKLCTISQIPWHFSTSFSNRTLLSASYMCHWFLSDHPMHFHENIAITHSLNHYYYSPPIFPFSWIVDLSKNNSSHISLVVDTIFLTAIAYHSPKNLVSCSSILLIHLIKLVSQSYWILFWIMHLQLDLISHAYTISHNHMPWVWITKKIG